MLDFHQKRKVKSVLYHKATLAVLAVIVLFFIHSTWSVYQKKRVSEEMKNISLKSVEDLRERDKELQEKIDRLKTDAGIEAEIRSKFSVAKENENVVIIVEEKEKVEISTPKQHFWTKFKGFFVW